MSSINKTILISILVILTISTAIQIYIINYCFTFNSSYFSIVAFLSLIGFLTIFFYIFNCLMKLRTVNNDLQIQILNNKILSDLYDKTRTLKHDFSNIIQAFGGYIWAKDISGLKNYYSDILGEFKSINSLTTLTPTIIKNPAIYTLLANKYLLAEDNGIKIDINISSDLENLQVNSLELVRILGILLDNSIEGCLECLSENRIININIYEKDSSKYISIENTYKSQSINIDKIYEKNYSTKNRNTGIGLWEVKKYINKTENLNLSTTASEKFFKQELAIS